MTATTEPAEASAAGNAPVGAAIAMRPEVASSKGPECDGFGFPVPVLSRATSDPKTATVIRKSWEVAT
jgi:hypothetical protein